MKSKEMKKNILALLILFLSINLSAQNVKSYQINAEFFPEDAIMHGNEVSSEAFMRANSTIELEDTENDNIVFYLHGELVVDSILSGNKNIEFDNELVFY